MKTILLYIQLAIVLLLLQVMVVYAQEKDEDETSVEIEDFIGEFSIAGSLDTYFHQAIGTIEDAPNTSFSNLPGFSLGMVNLIAAYSSKHSGFVVDLVFGPRGSDAVFNSSLYVNPTGNGSSHIIGQMYAYYQLSRMITISLGQFNTFLGYETISPTPNFHYSTSYLFSWGPFNHTGLLADLDLGNGWAAKLSVMNPTDFTAFNPFNTYTLGGQLSYAKKFSSVSLSAISGDQDGRLKRTDTVNSVSAGNNFQIDLTAGTNLSKKYYLGINASYRGIGVGEIITANGIKNANGDTFGFYGVAFYQKYTFSDAISVGLRAESFSEFEGGVGAVGGYNELGDANISEITLSANLIRGGFRVIPEFRLDIASQNTFTKKSIGEAVNTMPSFNLAVVYSLPISTYKAHSR